LWWAGKPPLTFQAREGWWWAWSPLRHLKCKWEGLWWAGKPPLSHFERVRVCGGKRTEEGVILLLAALKPKEKTKKGSQSPFSLFTQLEKYK